MKEVDTTQRRSLSEHLGQDIAGAGDAQSQKTWNDLEQARRASLGGAAFGAPQPYHWRCSFDCFRWLQLSVLLLFVLLG
jgi:hypothetical protein